MVQALLILGLVQFSKVASGCVNNMQLIPGWRFGAHDALGLNHVEGLGATLSERRDV